jgi:hypothetical protein
MQDVGLKSLPFNMCKTTDIVQTLLLLLLINSYCHQNAIQKIIHHSLYYQVTRL